jgi:hypothetical protein
MGDFFAGGGCAAHGKAEEKDREKLHDLGLVNSIVEFSGRP